MYTLKYPIGTATIPDNISRDNIDVWIQKIEELPTKLVSLVENLTQKQIDTPYRDMGWTIRQVIHHLADSHQHSYTRFKWALTEDKPIIKAYYEERWAELEDGKHAPIELSLNVLSALHAKWVHFLRTLSDEQLLKIFIHPETKEKVSLAKNIGIYAWHGEHHYEHINQLIIRNNWKT